MNSINEQQGADTAQFYMGEKLGPMYEPKRLLKSNSGTGNLNSSMLHNMETIETPLNLRLSDQQKDDNLSDINTFKLKSKVHSMLGAPYRNMSLYSTNSEPANQPEPML